jgi:hypothetical protein
MWHELGTSTTNRRRIIGELYRTPCRGGSLPPAEQGQQSTVSPIERMRSLIQTLGFMSISLLQRTLINRRVAVIHSTNLYIDRPSSAQLLQRSTREISLDRISCNVYGAI